MRRWGDFFCHAAPPEALCEGGDILIVQKKSPHLRIKLRGAQLYAKVGRFFLPRCAPRSFMRRWGYFNRAKKIAPPSHKASGGAALCEGGAIFSATLRPPKLYAKVGIF